MKTLVLALLAACTLAVNPSQADDHKSMPVDVGVGRVAWFDITTSDIAKSRDFYTKMFNWKLAPVKGTDQAFEIVVGDQAIGTLRTADGTISPFDGVVYIQVDDIRAVYAHAKELGATLVPGFPFNLPNGTGSIGLMADPSGHPLGIYSRTLLPAEKTSTK